MPISSSQAVRVPRLQARQDPERDKVSFFSFLTSIDIVSKANMTVHATVSGRAFNTQASDGLNVYVSQSQ
jgi:hypothetical protein